MEAIKKEFIDIFKSARGIVSMACARIGISRTTYYNWRSSDEEFKQKTDEVLEEQGDFVESQLLANISAGDTTAIIFYCKTKLKNRGYTEKPMPPQQRQPDKALSVSPETNAAMQKRILNKKRYIVKLLKEQGKYTAELSMQCEIAAQLWAKADMLKEEVFSESYTPVKIELSREGNERMLVNPKEALFQGYLKQTQAALRALGMNTESKERKSDNDGFVDFLKQFEETEE